MLRGDLGFSPCYAVELWLAILNGFFFLEDGYGCAAPVQASSTWGKLSTLKRLSHALWIGHHRGGPRVLVSAPKMFTLAGALDSMFFGTKNFDNLQP